MKPFDERFADRVRDEFDAYREDVDPAAFDQIRRRLRNDRAFMSLFSWKIAAAASILLISAAGLWWARPLMQTDPAEMPGSDIAESRSPKQDVDPDLQQYQTVEPDMGPPEPVKPVDQQQLIVQQDPGESSQVGQGTPKPPTGNEHIQQQIAVAETGIYNRLAVQPGRTGEIGQSVATGKQELSETTGLPERSESDDQPAFAVNADTTEGDRLAGQSGLPEGDIIPGRNMPVAAADPIVPEPSGSWGTGTSFGITAGSMVSYTSSQFAGGVGFFAGALQEWQITESLSLSSGGMLAWNRFDFEPAGETSADQALAQQFTTLSAARSDVDLDYDTRREFSWIALDIPLNMKWDVGGNSRGRYNLTLGLSSLIYLQQRFLDEGTNYTGVVERDAVTGMYEVDIQGIRYSERENEKAFSRFDLARLMNVAVGYSVRNKKNPLTFELYMKYPLGNLTSREISFGMGGISIRYAIGR